MTRIKAVEKEVNSINENDQIEEDQKEDNIKNTNNSINVETVRDKVENINNYVDKIEKIVNPIYERETQKLNSICKEVENVKDVAKSSGKRLDDNKLEVLLLDLVIEIGYVMERIEERALDVDIANAFLEDNTDKALLYANEVKDRRNLTNASLQKAYANNMVSLDKYTYIVKNRIYKKIEAKVNSAEKLFYGIKAILGKRL
jgi:hypothetical protein